MNPTRRSLLVSRHQRRVQSKSSSTSTPLRAAKSKPSLPAAKNKPAAGVSKSERSRDSILEAAAKLFRRQGYSATTLRQIAATAEIKAASIYYYFDSKEAILDEVLHRGLLSVFEAVKTALRQAGKASHRRRIGLAIEAHLVALLEAPLPPRSCREPSAPWSGGVMGPGWPWRAGCER